MDHDQEIEQALGELDQIYNNSYTQKMHVQDEIPVKEEVPPKEPEIKVEEPLPKTKDN